MHPLLIAILDGRTTVDQSGLLRVPDPPLGAGTEVAPSLMTMRCKGTATALRTKTNKAIVCNRGNPRLRMNSLSHTQFSTRFASFEENMVLSLFYRFSLFATSMHTEQRAFLVYGQ